jgi:hypothetical protein
MSLRNKMAQLKIIMLTMTLMMNSLDMKSKVTFDILIEALWT